jgi:hypothetical protein
VPDRQTRALLAAVFRSLAALVGRAADGQYQADLTAGDSHQHAATLSMLERDARDPPVPGFEAGLHEHGSSAEAYDALRGGGYDWGSVSHHDTNHPGRLANICLEPTSAKYAWWLLRVSHLGFPDATGAPGSSVTPRSNEALALSKIATWRTVEGEGGFLALSGREFTNYAFTPKGVDSREGGHKILVLSGETPGSAPATERSPATSTAATSTGSTAGSRPRARRAAS